MTARPLGPSTPRPLGPSGVAALALLLLAGCGFAPEDSFTGRRIGDGIAPWDDLGGLRLCLGNNFVGAPASEPGGLCTPPGAVNPPCNDDADCGSRERCVCGGCTVQYCTANSDCTGGQVCTFGSVNANRCDTPCATDNDCADGESCIEPRCVKRCETDAECQTGELCATIGLRRVCAVKACNDDADCTGGDICRIQRVPRVATEPTAVVTDTGLVMYLEMSDEFQQDQRAIYRAVSNDGVNYRVDPATPVVEDGGAAHAPSVVRDGNRFVLYYESGDGASINRVESADGISFGTASIEVPGGSTPIRAPAAARLPNGDVAVYYQVGDGTSIDLAGGGTALTPSDAIVPDRGDGSPFWVEVTAVRSPHVAVIPGEDGEPDIRLWFSAFGRESDDGLRLGEVVPTAPNFSIGYASAPVSAPADATTWPYNPVFDRISVFVDHLSELAPTVVAVDDETFLLYYIAADPDATALESIGVARNGGE